MLEKSAYIMVADDMKMVRTSVKKYLATLGYTNIIEAENGSDAVKKVLQSREENQKIGLILLDVVMPFMDGKEALKKIHEIDPRMPVVMLTSAAHQKIVDECRALGALYYLFKPMNAESGPRILGDIIGKL